MTEAFEYQMRGFGVDVSMIAKGGDRMGIYFVEKGASITSVPYHPGAAKFFEEKGYKVATA